MPRDFDGSRSQNHEKAFKAGNQTFELCQINLLVLELKACFITLRFFFDPLKITAKSIFALHSHTVISDKKNRLEY